VSKRREVLSAKANTGLCHGHISHLVHPKTHFIDRLQQAKRGPKNLANSFSDAIAILKKKIAGGDKSCLR